MAKKVFIDENRPTVRGTKIDAELMGKLNNPKFSSRDEDGHFDAGWEDPRAYGDGQRTGTNVALACVAAAASNGKVRLAGGTYTFASIVDLLGVPIDVMPGSHININSGCAPINFRVFGDPQYQVVACVLATTPNMLNRFSRPEWFGGGAVSDKDDLTYKSINHIAISQSAWALYQTQPYSNYDGGEVLFNAGVYLVCSEITLSPMLAGAGTTQYGTHFRGLDRSTILCATSDFTGAAIITIGNNVGQPMNLEFEGLSFTSQNSSTTLRGIALFKAVIFKIHSCTFNYIGTGVYLEQCGVCDISGNEFGSGLKYGVHVYYTYNLRIVNNDFQEFVGVADSRDVDYDARAIFLQFLGPKTLISNNVIGSCGGYAIYVGLSDTPYTNIPICEITNNQIYNTAGIYCDQNMVTISHNQIMVDITPYTHTAINIVAQGCSVMGNFIYGFAQGIDILYGLNNVVGNTVQNCNENGIYIRGTYNNVSNNVIFDIRVTPLLVYGIQDIGNNNTVRGNLVSGSQTRAFATTNNTHITQGNSTPDDNNVYTRLSYDGPSVQHFGTGDVETFYTGLSAGDKDVRTWDLSQNTSMVAALALKIKNADDSVSTFRMRAVPGATAADVYFAINSRVVANGGLGSYGVLPPSTQPAHIANCAVAAGANPTKAEYDDLVGKFNILLARMESFGMQATL